MELTEAQKEEIELLAGLKFSPETIAVIIEVDVRAFLQAYGYSKAQIDEILKKYDAQSEVFKLIEKGRLKSEAELRKSIFDMAKAGSSPAQSMAREIERESKIRELCFQ